MLYRFLADAIVLLHLGFVVFVVLGGLLVLRWRRVAWVHVPAVLWGAAIEFAGWVCPLTPLENRLRVMGGAAGYEGGFIEHYVTAILYPSGLTRPAQIALGISALAVNLVVYVWILRRKLAVRKTVACLIVLVGVAVQPALGLPKPKEKWIRVETENFVLFSNEREPFTTEVGLNLERFRKALETIGSAEMTFSSAVPTYIYVFKNTQSFKSYATLGNRDDSLVGLFTSHRDGNYVAINATPSLDPFEIIYHEYVHDYLHKNVPPPVPVWFDEGLAEYYSTFTVDKNRVEIGRPLGRHVHWLRQQPLIPLERLFSIDHESEEYSEGEKSGAFYAQSWALVHYLFSGSNERRVQLARFLDALTSGTPMEQAFAKAFETSYQGLLEELVVYLEADKFPFTRYTFKELSINEKVKVEPMERAEVLYRLGDYLAHYGPERTVEAREHLREALKLRPDHPHALSGLAFLLDQDRKHGEAASYHEKALARAGDDPRLCFLFAESLVMRFSEESEGQIAPTEALPEPLARARSLYSKSLQRNPEFGPAYAGLGYTYLFDPGDPEPGIAALEKARSLMHDSEEVAYNLVLLHLANDDRPSAEAVERDVLRNGKNRGLAERAREALLQHELKTADMLLRAGKLDQGLAIVEKVLHETREERVKNLLIRQALDIRQLIEHNHWIDEYNRAVDLARNGKIDEATAILEEMEATVTDPDLKKLATELLWRIRNLPGRRQSTPPSP